LFERERVREKTRVKPQLKVQRKFSSELLPSSASQNVHSFRCIKGASAACPITSCVKPLGACHDRSKCRDARLESVLRSKAEVERHHDMDRAGNLLRCADRRRSVLGLTMTMCSPNVGLKPNGVALMSKPDENDKQPDSAPRLLGKWTLPDNCRIVERTGEKFALVGPPMRRIEPSTSPQ